MKDFKIAIIQHESVVMEKENNLKKIINLVNEAVKDKDVKLILMPELNITGHVGHSDIISQAEEVPNGNAVKTLEKTAAEKNVYICAGIAEIDNGVHYNTQFIVGPEGYVGKQRKIHLSGDEYFYFRGGSQINVFQLPFAKVGMIICYDNMHPEMARVMALKGVEVILAPHASRALNKENSMTEEEIKNTIKMYKEGWNILQRARAGDNNVYVALTNMCGISAPHIDSLPSTHIGGCMLIDPYAQIVAESKSESIKDEIVYAKLSSEIIKMRHKEECNPLRTRKPEVFYEISKRTE